MSTLPTDNPTALLQQMHRWRMAFFGLIVLLAGAVIGASGTLLFLKPKPPEPPDVPELFIGRTFSELERNLNLTDQQKTQINQIMRQRMEEMRRIREEDMRPRVFAEMGQLKDEIGKVLTDEQMKLWEKRMERFRGEFWRGRGGGPGGGMRGGPGGRMGSGGPGSGGSRGPGGGMSPGGPGGGSPRGLGGGMSPGGPGGGMRGSDDRDGQRFRGGQDGSPMRGPGARMPFRRGPNTVPEPNGVPEPNSTSEPNLVPEPNTIDIL